MNLNPKTHKVELFYWTTVGDGGKKKEEFKSSCPLLKDLEQWDVEECSTCDDAVTTLTQCNGKHASCRTDLQECTLLCFFSDHNLALRQKDSRPP